MAACGRDAASNLAIHSVWEPMFAGPYVPPAATRRFWTTAIVHAIRARSWMLIGHTRSHSTQYASIILFVSIDRISARPVYACCSRCSPQAGQVEAKMRGFFMERPSLCSAVRGGDTHWRRVLEIRLDPCARIVALAYYVAMTLV